MEIELYLFFVPHTYESCVNFTFCTHVSSKVSSKAILYPLDDVKARD